MRDEAEAIKNLYWPEEGGRASGGRVGIPRMMLNGRELGDAFRYSRASLRESLGRPEFVATRGPIDFNQEEAADPEPPPGEESVQSQWSNPSHDIVRDLEEYAPEGRPLTRREVEDAVSAVDRRPGISIDDPRVRLGPPDADAPARYRMVPDCGNDHGDLGALTCPWCTVSIQQQRLEERREEVSRLRLRGAVLTCEDHQEDAEDYDGCPVCNEEGEEARVRREEYATLENQQIVRAANRLLQVWSDLDTSSAPIPRHFRIRMENAASNLRAARA